MVGLVLCEGFGTGERSEDWLLGHEMGILLHCVQYNTQLKLTVRVYKISYIENLRRNLRYISPEYNLIVTSFLVVRSV